MTRSQRSLPSVVELGGAARLRHASGPLKALLMELGLADLNELTDSPEPAAQSCRVLSHPERAHYPASSVPAIGSRLLVPSPLRVSYRASTGTAQDGRHRALSPGRHVSIAQIEASDGSSHTAGFAERLVGDHRLEHPRPPISLSCRARLAARDAPRSAPTAWARRRRRVVGRQRLAIDGFTTTRFDPERRAPSCIALDRRSAFMKRLDAAQPRRGQRPCP